MLKQRVVTALILVIVLLAALLTSNPLFWRLLISAVLYVAFWEWLRFCEMTELFQQLGGFVAFSAVYVILQLGLVPMQLLLIVTSLLWLLLLFSVLTNSLPAIHQPVLKMLIGVWVLSVAGYLMIELKGINYGVLWVLCFMVAVWAADIGAYFVGRRFGKTKLAPNISPGKTVEGLLGGLLFTIIVFVPIFIWSFDVGRAFMLTLIIVLTALISVGGDLFESKLKRHVGLKDSSQILPGHGGVLDRIDSMIAGAPFFMFGLLWLGYLN